MDLIFAEATPPGRGGVSIVRLSGPGARETVEKLVGALPESRRTYHRPVVDSGETIDHALVFRADEGASFTGEEMSELQLHGAPVVVRRVCVALADLGARPAQAGEFTRRAFLNGRMDLAEIEGLGDLLAAETEAQRRLALRTTNGELTKKALEWRSLFVRAGALVEASVDFADEDVTDEVPKETYQVISRLHAMLMQELMGFPAAERIRQGFDVAVIGPPNAGKSSLVNRLAHRDVALVSDIAGTTRDVIEVRLDLGGLAVTLLDTAGLRHALDTIERAGIAVALRRAEAADLRVHLSENGETVPELWREGDICLKSKADLSASIGVGEVSAATGEGIDVFLEQLHVALVSRVAGAGLISHERQRWEISCAVDALSGVESLPPEILSERLRAGGAALDRLLGKIDAEDYLDVVFSSFCIGK